MQIVKKSKLTKIKWGKIVAQNFSKKSFKKCKKGFKAGFWSMESPIR